MGQSAYPVLLTSAMEDGPTLVAAARASMLHARRKPVLPNHYWRENRQWRITAAGRISCAVTTPGTARFDVSIGGVVVFDSLAINLNIVAKVNVGWWLEIWLHCRSVGSLVNTQLFGQGRWFSEAIIASQLPTVAASGGVMLPVATAPGLGTAFDNALQNIADISFTQTVATGSMTCHELMIEELDKADG